jgi:hypothetical protein
MLQQNIPCSRKLDPGAITVKEFGLKMLFQFMDMFRHRRLRYK